MATRDIVGTRYSITSSAGLGSTKPSAQLWHNSRKRQEQVGPIFEGDTMDDAEQKAEAYFHTHIE